MISLGSGWSLLSLLVHGWDEMSDLEGLDQVSKCLIVLNLDVGNLDLGFLWDEVHLLLSLLL